MTFFSKLCILAIVAYVHASPRLGRAEGEAGNVWSKFLGKVPDYFTSESHELDASNGAEATANGEAQNDEIANDGAASYNPSQIQWQDQFKQCMSNYGQSPSSSSSSSSSSAESSSNQYGANQISGLAGNTDSYKENFEKCRSQVSNSMGQYPGANGGQDFLSQYKPQLPSNIPSNIGSSNFGSYTSALSGSSPSSGSSASA